MICFIPPSLRTGLADLPTYGSPVGGLSSCEDWRTNSWAAASTSTHIWQSFLWPPSPRAASIRAFQSGGSDPYQSHLSAAIIGSCPRRLAVAGTLSSVSVQQFGCLQVPGNLQWSRLHLPAPLCSPRVTRVPHSYGCSDSYTAVYSTRLHRLCRAGLPA